MTEHALTILSTTIRRDDEGRYCLNDCHRASGGDPSKRPGVWLQNRQTQEQIAYLEGHAGIPACPVSVLNDGFNNGTYAVDDLVLTYAAWVSVEFHFQVFRTFKAMLSLSAPAEPSTPLQAVLRQLADSLDDNERLRAALAEEMSTRLAAERRAFRGA